MEYFLIALVSTPFLVGIAIILYKTLDVVVTALIILIDFLVNIFPHFSWDTTCGPWFFHDADGNKGMVIYYCRHNEHRYFDLPDGSGGEAILNESLTNLMNLWLKGAGYLLNILH